MQSEKLTLNKTDWKRIGIGALVAIGGVLLTYATEAIGNIDFGEATPIVTGAWAIIVNIARKYLAGY